MPSKFHMVMITAPSPETAQSLAQGLVENGLAACVNIVPDIHSVYRWEGHIQNDTEQLLLCKTTDTCWQALLEWVLSHHPYDVPEVIQLPILEGSPTYLDWILSTIPLKH